MKVVLVTPEGRIISDEAQAPTPITAPDQPEETLAQVAARSAAKQSTPKPTKD